MASSEEKEYLFTILEEIWDVNACARINHAALVAASFTLGCSVYDETLLEDAAGAAGVSAASGIARRAAVAGAGGAGPRLATGGLSGGGAAATSAAQLGGTGGHGGVPNGGTSGSGGVPTDGASSATAGRVNGGSSSGGDASGGDSNGGDASGGDLNGGDSSGGDSTGGDASGGDSSGGDSSGGDSSGGDASGGDSSGGTAGAPGVGGDTGQSGAAGTTAIGGAGGYGGAAGTTGTGGASDVPTGGAAGAPAGGSAGVPTGGASGATATGGTAGAAGADVCDHYPASSEAITDFSDWTAADGSWGDETGLTGGSFTYAATNSSVELAVESEVLRVTATLAANEYGGFGLWFEHCLDASAFAGVTFTIGGDTGLSQILFQVQTSQNFPIDTENNRGECTGTWDDGCASNECVLDVPATATVTEVTWDLLSGGAPIDGVDPSELLGVQWQFNCGDAPCEVNITVDDVAFIVS